MVFIIFDHGGNNGISEKQSGLDIYSPNLISVSLADFASWTEIEGFESWFFVRPLNDIP